MMFLSNWLSKKLPKCEDKHLSKKQLTEIATQFRQAIITAKNNCEFDPHDRMSRFPSDCCDDTADLFTHYLFQKYGIMSKRVNGTCWDEDSKCRQGHAWQEIDGIIIDLTGSQFKDRNNFLNYDNIIYVGPMDSFHELFEVYYSELSTGIQNLNSSSWKRMNSLYKTITRYLAE